jgi:hypothetical protein
MATPDLAQAHLPTDIDLPTKEIDFYGTDTGRFGKAISQDALDLMAELRRLDLAEHIGELAVQGLTVIPPHKVTTPEMVQRLRHRLLEIAGQRTGVRYDLEQTATHPDSKAALGTVLYYILYEDPIFQQIVLNPTILAMTTYVCGKNAVLSIIDGLIKGPGTADLMLHCDHFMTPPPMSHIPNQVNNFLILTDMDQENGSTCFVPGSHHLRRQPMPGEGMDQRAPVIAKAGSLIVWDGNLWHGAFGRKRPGVRVALSVTFMRPHLRTFENYVANATPEILARNPPRFAQIIGKHINVGWTDHQGPRGGDVGLTVGRHIYE